MYPICYNAHFVHTDPLDHVHEQKWTATGPPVIRPVFVYAHYDRSASDAAALFRVPAGLKKSRLANSGSVVINITGEGYGTVKTKD